VKLDSQHAESPDCLALVDELGDGCIDALPREGVELEALHHPPGATDRLDRE
jgi:hypothetical protein